MITQLSKTIFASTLGITLALGMNFKVQAQVTDPSAPDAIATPGFPGDEMPTVPGFPVPEPSQSVPEPSATLALLVLTGSGLLVTRKHLS